MRRASFSALQESESIGSEGDGGDSADLDDGTLDARGEADADMDADSSAAEEMEDFEGDEAREPMAHAVPLAASESPVGQLSWVAGEAPIASMPGRALTS